MLKPYRWPCGETLQFYNVITKIRLRKVNFLFIYKVPKPKVTPKDDIHLQEKDGTLIVPYSINTPSQSEIGVSLLVYL